MMGDESVTGVHWSFWVIGAIALLCNLMGSMNYVAQMNAEVVASMPETHRASIEGRPAWATAGFALSVFGGALGGLLLLLEKSVASYLFMASLLGTIVMMILMPLVVAAFLVGYTRRAEQKGWLR